MCFASGKQIRPAKADETWRWTPYYRPEDVALLRGIRFLLYDDGYTIRGVQKILREQGPRFVMEQRPPVEGHDKKVGVAIGREIPDVAAEAAQSRSSGRPPGLQGEEPDAESLDLVLKELEDCRRILTSAKGS